MTKNANKSRIVVGVDMTETGDHALREAMRLAHLIDNSELHVTYVVRADKHLHDAKRLEEIGDDLRKVLAQLSAHTTEICAPTGGQEPFEREVVFHVRIGSPSEAIHQVAVDVEASLIVVGTHARRGVEKWILGSVAEDLVRSARVPVVVAHPNELHACAKTERPEPRREGEDLHAHGLSDRLHLTFRPRTSHVSGLL